MNTIVYLFSNYMEVVKMRDLTDELVGELWSKDGCIGMVSRMFPF